MFKDLALNIYNYLNATFASKEIITMILAASPLIEARYAIPIAHGLLELSLSKVFIVSVISNMIPVVPLLLLLEPVSCRLRHFKLWHNFFDRLFEHTRKRAQLVQRYEVLGLILFVSIPLPVTGAWTGCVAATLFKIRFRYAFFAILLGIIFASLISILTIDKALIWLKQYPF